MDAMHLLLRMVAIPAGLAVVAFLVGRYPINRALRWKEKATGDSKGSVSVSSVSVRKTRNRALQRVGSGDQG